MEIANVGMVLVGMVPVGILLVGIGTAPRVVAVATHLKVVLRYLMIVVLQISHQV